MDLKLNIKTYCGLLWSIFFGPLQLIQGAPHDLLHPRSQGMLHYQTCLHKRGVCTDYVGSCGQWALILQEKILLHQTLQQERRSTSLSRTLRVSLTPSTSLIQFSGQHSHENGGHNLQQTPLMVGYLWAHLQPNGEIRLQCRPWLDPDTKPSALPAKG